MPMITLRQLLDHAAEHDYAVPAFNINNMEQGLAIMEAAAACDAPVIIQASRGARNYANDIVLAKLIDALAEGTDPRAAGEAEARRLEAARALTACAAAAAVSHRASDHRHCRRDRRRR